MNSNAKLWIKTVREAEPKYSRGPPGYLKTVDQHRAFLGHSPLGIACDLARDAGVKFEETLTDEQGFEEGFKRRSPRKWRGISIP